MPGAATAPTPLLLFFPPEKNTLYLSPPSLSGSSAGNDPSPSQHVSATPIISIPILFISLKTFASLPDTYKLLTFHVAILLQSPTNDVKTPAPHAFYIGCSRFMTVRQRLLPHSHQTGPGLETDPGTNPYCR